MYSYSVIKSYIVCYYLVVFILFKKLVFNQGPMEDHLPVYKYQK